MFFVKFSIDLFKTYISSKLFTMNFQLSSVNLDP
jgi:hypothetical protein